MTIVTASDGRTFYWVEPGRAVTANDMDDFWQYVTKKTWDRKTSKENLNLNLFLNYWGNLGWELVSVNGSSQFGDATNYYFKRPVTK
ncbi:hypothetical protein [Deinococcus koreensis]|uniref:hypothetical protein n=1 Tax=Deinococcus koreensis TaxID=2054903 RepID=UPI0010571420|nr:hypothetical protein [Deinococcus koreensis]